VLLDPYVDVALVGMREPRFVELNNEISDDVASRIDLAVLHERKIVSCALGAELQCAPRCPRPGPLACG
jgi:hypothetical protein